MLGLTGLAEADRFRRPGQESGGFWTCGRMSHRCGLPITASTAQIEGPRDWNRTKNKPVESPGQIAIAAAEKDPGIPLARQTVVIL